MIRSWTHGVRRVVARTLARPASGPRLEALRATLVFADVSGFTAMSERLARRGKIGAEETTMVINRCFAGLERATRLGAGEILKFGGDAVLAWFEGSEHAVRGAAAALQMQQEMRELRRLRTQAGTVSLRLSTGVASGTAYRFLTSAEPRDLLLAGPLPSEVVACESAAGAGDVVVSAATAARLPERCLGEARGPGRLLRTVPPVPMVEVPAVPADVDLRSALPAHLRDHEPGDGEHRLRRIAFVQFRGTDAVLAADARRPSPRARRLLCAVQHACRSHGVTFVSTDVDRDAGKIILGRGAAGLRPRRGPDARGDPRHRRPGSRGAPARGGPPRPRLRRRRGQRRPARVDGHGRRDEHSRRG